MCLQKLIQIASAITGSLINEFLLLQYSLMNSDGINFGSSGGFCVSLFSTIAY